MLGGLACLVGLPGVGDLGEIVVGEGFALTAVEAGGVDALDDAES